MRAQWVCSREWRIALYKRSSINQSFILCHSVSEIKWPIPSTLTIFQDTHSILVGIGRIQKGPQHLLVHDTAVHTTQKTWSEPQVSRPNFILDWILTKWLVNTCHFTLTVSLFYPLPTSDLFPTTFLPWYNRHGWLVLKPISFLPSHQLPVRNSKKSLQLNMVIGRFLLH